MDVDLSEVDASFIGDGSKGFGGSIFSSQIDGAGDVGNDGYDDILIGYQGINRLAMMLVRSISFPLIIPLQRLKA